MVTIMMSAVAISALQRDSLWASAVYSEAEWIEKLRPGMRRIKASRALAAALLRCVSMVRMTTLTEFFAIEEFVMRDGFF